MKKSFEKGSNAIWWRVKAFISNVTFKLKYENGTFLLFSGQSVTFFIINQKSLRFLQTNVKDLFEITVAYQQTKTKPQVQKTFSYLQIYKHLKVNFYQEMVL